MTSKDEAKAAEAQDSLNGKCEAIYDRLTASLALLDCITGCDKAPPTDNPLLSGTLFQLEDKIDAMREQVDRIFDRAAVINNRL